MVYLLPTHPPPLPGPATYHSFTKCQKVVCINFQQEKLMAEIREEEKQKAVEEKEREKIKEEQVAIMEAERREREKAEEERRRKEKEELQRQYVLHSPLNCADLNNIVK